MSIVFLVGGEKAYSNGGELVLVLGLRDVKLEGLDVAVLRMPIVDHLCSPSPPPIVRHDTHAHARHIRQREKSERHRPRARR